MKRTGISGILSALDVRKSSESVIFALSSQRISLLGDELFYEKFLCRGNFRAIRISILPNT
jgi:hypothetical protein